MASTRTPPFSLGAIAVIAVTGVTATTLADDWCGTRVRPEDVPIVRDLMAMGFYDPPAEPLGAPYVPLTLHVVRDSNGNGGLSDERLVRALDDANLYYANSGITFCWPGPTDYIDDDDFCYNIDTMDEIDALRQTNVVPDTINIYFTENLAYEGGSLCGISSFTFSPVQGIVMANGCTATDDNHSTFPHEIGHYFDLFHTHETAFGVECVARTNCDEAGDLLCDTPADPGLYQGGVYYVDEECQYTGDFPSPCDGDPPYDPDTANLMSCSRKHCRTHFSSQQDDRALATLVNLRLELINDDCPGEGQWNLDGKLLAADGATYDRFGCSVSLSADTALAGAYADNDYGPDSGSAYVFRKVGGLWVQEAKLLPFDGAEDDRFGACVALSADTALVGAYRDDDHGWNSGSAYVFEKVAGAWTQVAKLTPSDGGWDDQFGNSVSLCADTALVGARYDEDNGTKSGSAYVFQKINGVWTQTAKLLAADGAREDQFGFSVSVSGDTALVGAAFDDDHGTTSGSAYVFQKINGVWTQVAKLTAADGAQGDWFAYSLSLSGDTALIGAHSADDQGPNAGAAYVFREVAGVWVEEAKLLASDGAAHDAFGVSVSLSGDTALVGAQEDDDHGPESGSAYLFQRAGRAWTQVAKLTASDGASSDLFGGRVALSDDAAVVGAYSDDDNGTNSGSAYVFRDLNALRNPCPGDLDGDWDTDPDDLVILLGDWGCTGGNCPGDLDNDHDTDQADLGILLADWGCTP